MKCKQLIVYLIYAIFMPIEVFYKMSSFRRKNDSNEKKNLPPPLGHLSMKGYETHLLLVTLVD